ncbi:hypothetical protein ACIPY6_35435 [Streptomyces sp. NPDC090054]|uniref:hypothetical protein n=1 Tax=Streptomyces sp. NPDC090054 TaxID=3365933 RepID=UPI0038110FC7
MLNLAEPAKGAARLSARAAASLGLLGVAAVTAQGVIDLVVGLRAQDHAAMKVLFEEIQRYPGVMPVVYTVGPPLFYVGLLWLTIQLAAQRLISAWHPALVFLGTGTMVADLDLLPLGALFFLVALAPLWRTAPGVGPHGPERTPLGSRTST